MPSLLAGHPLPQRRARRVLETEGCAAGETPDPRRFGPPEPQGEVAGLFLYPLSHFIDSGSFGTLIAWASLIILM